ncbi:uncharacterized protein P174DRAFT_461940 [Aspergillus novofumigatus IBT 16806]|uniref:Secreted protein CSS2 C-terminal domain-containing protein n=1 Tax=Aspergillus novofumigatus (strain IBT 16806) TaxID=1392255 RepID=A0A2I1C136_ASPN1|nr:uncharacterized protein P174DRAFT_461940 [Aspergillus novofumigatus IBT 16806]PKX91346.1 hypothetical protein P174DRAFT_461940 [Aspergillus novofumigatus IBT 16806]
MANACKVISSLLAFGLIDRCCADDNVTTVTYTPITEEWTGSGTNLTVTFDISKSNQNSCSLVYGTDSDGTYVEGYAYEATTSGENCDTTAEKKTILSIMSIFKFVSWPRNVAVRELRVLCNMRVTFVFASLAAIQPVVCQSSFNGAGDYNLSTATRSPHSQDLNPDGSHPSRRFGEWILKRDTTIISDAVTSTTATETVTSVTTTSRSDATTTSESTTTSSTSTTASSFTTTTAGTTTTSSTSSTTTTSSSSTSTAASTTTNTATTTTTTSTTTPSPTESAELKEWNHRGTIAAIVTFSILGSFFVCACIARCFRNRVKKRRIETRDQPDQESSLSRLAPRPENGTSASQLKVDRESIMFCDERSVPSLSGQPCWQGSIGHSSMPSEDMGRSMSSGRHTLLGVREQHGTAEV